MKKIKKSLGLCLFALFLVGLLACGGSSKNIKTIRFMYGGGLAEAAVYSKLIKAFNETKGNELGVRVQGIPKSGAIDSVLASKLPSNDSPDVAAVSDEYFKKYAKYYENLSDKISQPVLDNLYKNTLSRYHYNLQTTTTNETDPLYAVPVYNDTTVLYYNKTVLQENGVICISVNEEDLDAFNAGTLADANGKRKGDYGIEINVPAKGFYRSNYPYVPAENEINGKSWKLPTKTELLIFNDKIAMNWDEIEDIGMLCTKEKNPKSKSSYGFYTEWWFNYGWSIGGDCAIDITGNGDWIYGLPSDTPNYIVQSGKNYTGLYSGTVYEEGETLNVYDILNAAKGDELYYDSKNDTTFYYTVNGKRATIRDFTAEISDGTLAELPSTRKAFSRFCYLAGKGGINISPYPSVFVGTNSPTYFTSGDLAFLLERVSFMDSINKNSIDEWSIAPLPQYKLYNDPEDPDCDSIVAQGKVSSHSFGYGMIVSNKSRIKDETIDFVEWAVSEGQKILAENGYLSSRPMDSNLVKENYNCKNPEVVLDSLSASRAGDWWYMPDRSWIDTWAAPLNNKLRYGEMTFDEFIYTYIDATNQRLKEYKN